MNDKDKEKKGEEEEINLFFIIVGLHVLSNLNTKYM